MLSPVVWISAGYLIRLKEVSDLYDPLSRCSFKTARIVSKTEPPFPPEYFCAPHNLQNTSIIWFAQHLLIYKSHLLFYLRSTSFFNFWGHISIHGRKVCTFLLAVVKCVHFYYLLCTTRSIVITIIIIILINLNTLRTCTTNLFTAVIWAFTIKTPMVMHLFCARTARTSRVGVPVQQVRTGSIL